MLRRVGTAIAMLAVATVGVAACGSDSSAGPYVAPTGPPVKTIDLSASNFSFDPEKITAPAGILQFNLTSADGLHDLVIDGIAGFQVEVTSGSSSSGKVELEAGKYTFYCGVVGHRAGGMVGTLTVT